jgi:hypothetical protein
MASVTYSGTFGGNQGTGGLSTTLSGTPLPSDAVVSEIVFYLHMTSTTFSSSYDWQIFDYLITNGPGVTGGPYYTEQMSDDEIYWARSLPNSPLTAFSDSTIYLYCRANNSHPTAVSYMWETSVEITYTIPTECGAPTTVEISDETPLPSTDVTLSWSGATAGTINTITGYDIYRATIADGEYTYLKSETTTETSGSTTVTSHSDIGSSYYYKVLTKGSAGTSYYSALSTVYATVTSSLTACIAPTTVTPSTETPILGSTIALSWSGAAPGTNNAITGYNIYRAPAVGGTYVYLAYAASTSTSGSKSGIAVPPVIGDSYFFKVRTIGTITGYNSPYSSVHAQITTILVPCTAPTEVGVSTSVVNALSQVRLYWTGATKGGSSEITGYAVYRDTSATGTYIDLLDTISTDETYGNLLVTAPSNGDYYYKIVTLGDTGDYTSEKSTAYATLTVGSAPVVSGTVGWTNASGWWS